MIDASFPHASALSQRNRNHGNTHIINSQHHVVDISLREGFHDFTPPQQLHSLLHITLVPLYIIYNTRSLAADARGHVHCNHGNKE